MSSLGVKINFEALDQAALQILPDVAQVSGWGADDFCKASDCGEVNRELTKDKGVLILGEKVTGQDLSSSRPLSYLFHQHNTNPMAN